MTEDTAKLLIKDAAYNYCNVGHQNFIYHILEEAFVAGAQSATFNGVPGFPDSPRFDEWIRLKAFEEL